MFVYFQENIIFFVEDMIEIFCLLSAVFPNPIFPIHEKIAKPHLKNVTVYPIVCNFLTKGMKAIYNILFDEKNIKAHF